MDLTKILSAQNDDQKLIEKLKKENRKLKAFRKAVEERSIDTPETESLLTYAEGAYNREV